MCKECTRAFTKCDFNIPARALTEITILYTDGHTETGWIDSQTDSSIPPKNILFCGGIINVCCVMTQ